MPSKTEDTNGHRKAMRTGIYPTPIIEATIRVGVNPCSVDRALAGSWAGRTRAVNSAQCGAFVQWT